MGALLTADDPLYRELYDVKARLNPRATAPFITGDLEQCGVSGLSNLLD
jgi:hypothetical protein